MKSCLLGVFNASNPTVILPKTLGNFFTVHFHFSLFTFSFHFSLHLTSENVWQIHTWVFIVFYTYGNAFVPSLKCFPILLGNFNFHENDIWKIWFSLSIWVSGVVRNFFLTSSLNSAPNFTWVYQFLASNSKLLNRHIFNWPLPTFHPH